MWNLKKYKDNIAIVEENGEIISYSEFDSYIKELIQNIPERCLVFNMCRNEIGSLVGYVGFLNAQIVPLMLKADLEEELFQVLLETYKPSYIWLPAENAGKYPFEAIYSKHNYALLRTNNKKFPLNDELALLLTTSGSTGSPKLVRQSYKNIEANTKSIVEYLKLDQTERPITTLPMNYTYGLSILNTHLWVGASIVLTEKGLMQKEFWQQFKEFEATSFGGVPYTYEMLARLRFFSMKLPSLCYMTQAGGKLSPELHAKFAEWAQNNGKKFIVMYGQTEATARMSYLPAEMSLAKYGSMGIAIPGGKLSLIDINGQLITQPETVGELVYEGDNVTLGYAQCGEDLALGDDRNGKLITGDMAKFDSDGFFYIVGRKKRFLKIYGNRVNLDETERLIKAQFPEIECACAGVDDNMAIFIKDSSYKDKIVDYIAEKTGLNRAAFKTVIIDEIPKNEAGKTLYNELEKKIERL
ncbi:MAG: AMP-binding protein [Spirochaetia bacterium]|nr:AMP-binding protein [Spirochaetia bacterium]